MFSAHSPKTKSRLFQFSPVHRSHSDNPSTPSNSGRPPATDMADSPNRTSVWECQACTYSSNDAQETVCDVCHAPREADAEVRTIAQPLRMRSISVSKLGSDLGAPSPSTTSPSPMSVHRRLLPTLMTSYTDSPKAYSPKGFSLRALPRDPTPTPKGPTPSTSTAELPPFEVVSIVEPFLDVPSMACSIAGIMQKKKRGMGFNTTAPWRPKHCTLNPASKGILMYREKEGVEGGRGHISIQGATIRCSDEVVDNQNMMQFEITPKESKNITYRFRCNLTEADKWKDAFRQFGGGVYVPLRSGVLISGAKKPQPRVITLYYDILQARKPTGEKEVTEELHLNQHCMCGKLGGSEDTVLVVRSLGGEGALDLLLRAQSNRDRATWIYAITSVLKTKPRIQCKAGSLFEGFLYKVGGKTKTEAPTRREKWQPRYFALFKDKLAYFRRPEDNDPAGIVDLNQGAEVEEEENDQVAFLFSLARNGDAGQRKYYLHARTKQERELWVGALSLLLKTKVVMKNKSSQKEGYLYRMKNAAKISLDTDRLGAVAIDTHQRAWDKYFCTLEDTTLYLYKRRGDQKSFQTIPIPPGSVVGTYPGHANIFSFAPTGDEGQKLYFYKALSTEDSVDWVQKLRNSVGPMGNVHKASIFEGYLYKTGAKKGDGWRKRWAVLFPDKLSYYRKRLDLEPAGSIPLSGGAEVEMDHASTENPYGFYVAPSGDDDARRYKFQAMNGTDLRRWVSRIDLTIRQMERKEYESSVLEDYFWRLEGAMAGAAVGTGMLSGQWVKRFFVLFPRKLCVYKRRADREPLFSTELDGASVIETLSDADIKAKGIKLSARSFYFSIVRNRDEGAKICYASARSVEDRTTWVDALSSVVATMDKHLHVASLREQYFAFRSADMTGKEKWTNRYIVLFQDKLEMYKGRDDIEPVSSISLKFGTKYGIVDSTLEDSSKDASKDGKEEEEEDKDATKQDGGKECCFTVSETGDATEKNAWELKGAQTNVKRWMRDLNLVAKPVKKARGSVHEGYLSKLGGLNSNKYQQRYFVVVDGYLYWFRSKRDHKYSGLLELTEEIKITPLDTPMHGLSITGGEKQYVLAAESEQEQGKWLEVLKNEVAKAQTSALFGAPLEYAMLYSNYDVIPTPIAETILFLLKPGASHLQTEGLLVDPVPSTSTKLTTVLDAFRGGTQPNLDDPRIAAACLSVYLCSLEDPLLSHPIYRRVKYLFDKYEPAQVLPPDAPVDKNLTSLVADALEALPRLQHNVLCYVLNFLHQLIQEIGNGVTAYALAQRLFTAFIPLLNKEVANNNNNNNNDKRPKTPLHKLRMLATTQQPALTPMHGKDKDHLGTQPEGDVSPARVSPGASPRGSLELHMQTIKEEKDRGIYVLSRLIVGYRDIFPRGAPVPMRRIDQKELEELMQRVQVSLNDVLSTEDALIYYRLFCQENFVPENLACYEEVHRWNINAKENKEGDLNEARRIVQIYLSGGEMQVNVSSRFNKAASELLSVPDDYVVPLNVFDGLLIELKRLLSSNSFARFKKSKYWGNIVMFFKEHSERDEMRSSVPEVPDVPAGEVVDSAPHTVPDTPSSGGHLTLTVIDHEKDESRPTSPLSLDHSRSDFETGEDGSMQLNTETADSSHMEARVLRAPTVPAELLAGGKEKDIEGESIVLLSPDIPHRDLHGRDSLMHSGTSTPNSLVASLSYADMPPHPPASP